MARLYRSRARRRTRRLAVLAAVSAVFAVADVAAGNPALGVLADTRVAVSGLVGSPAGSYAAPASSGAPRTPTPAPAPAPVPVPGTGATGPGGSPGTGPGGGSGGGPGAVPIESVPAGQVALTIDDGPDPRWTPQVLDLLAAHGVHATFCLVGGQVRAHPDLVRRIAAEGHALCDHTESHDVHLPSRPRGTVEREVRSAYDEIVVASGGVRPALFRAPGGNWSPAIVAEAAELDMRPLGWNVDTRDWTRPGTAAIVTAIRTAPSGAVILVHDAGGDRAQTVAALRAALPTLRSRGLDFVTP